MNTLKYKMVDGLKIVTGFTQSQVDPRATATAAATAMQGSNVLGEFNAAEVSLSEEIKRLRIAKGNGVQLRGARLTRLRGIHKVKRAALVVAIKKHHKEHPVTFGLRANEESPEELDALAVKFKQLGSNEKLRTDGEVVPDLRGVGYLEQGPDGWVAKAITTIDTPLPEDVVLLDDITADIKAEMVTEAEARRMAALTNVQKLNEKNAALEGAAATAAMDRSKQEIKGASAADALAASQALYQDLTAEIEAKYS